MGAVAGVSGPGFLASRRGVPDLFSASTMTHHRVLFRTSVGRKRRSAAALCLSGGFFQHSRACLGDSRKSHASTCEQERLAKKITRAWHHSRSLVHAEKRACGLPEELCFLHLHICRMTTFLVENREVNAKTV